MRPQIERRLLQLTIALASIIPLSMGSLSIFEGAQIIKGVGDPVPIDLDSHFRYLSGLLLGIGLVFLAALPRIERSGTLVRALGFIILVGAFGRLLSLLQSGSPSAGHLMGLAMELIGVPLIVLWQARVERLYAARADDSPNSP